MHPDCTSGGDCPYQAEWVVSGDSVRFRVSSNVAASNWVAIGFSNDQRMGRPPPPPHTHKTMLVCDVLCCMPTQVDSDVIAGAANGDQSFISDR